MKIDIIKIKAFGIPVALFVASVVLYIVGGKILINQIKQTQQKINKLKEETSVLETKVTVLSNFGLTSSNYVNIVSAALPEKNSGLIFITQVKKAIQSSDLVVSEIKIGSPAVEGGLSKAQLSFNVDGSLTEVLAFLGSMAKISPISRIEKVRINQTGTVARAAVTVSIFWANFPKKLPDITEPIKELTNDEQTTLSQLGQRTQPQFLKFVPSATSERSDPFSL